MNETIGSALILGMEKIQNGIMTVAPEAWRIMLKQQYVTAVQLIVSMVMCCVGVYALYRFAKYCEMKDEASSSYDSGWSIPYVFAWLFIFVCIVVFIVQAISLPGYIINPEYYALKEIMGLIL